MVEGVATRQRLPIGARIGRFEITGVLGAGGMGIVYDARDPDLGRPVAIKLIHEPDLQHSLRLLREAHALARLQHPNVIAVHEVGQHDDEIYVAMERVEGTSLDRHTPRPASWRSVVALFGQVGRGLAAAHAKGLVHRDIKPHNILVGRDGRVRVADFGLARLADAPERAGEPPAPLTPTPDDKRRVEALAETVDDSDSVAVAEMPPRAGALGVELTDAAAYLGTPRYMAPEQHLRKPATARSDQFSFCVALWEALFREHPFVNDGEGSWIEAVTNDRRRRPPRGKAPGWLVAALDRGLSIDPARRHASMAALTDLLERTPIRRRRFAVAGGATLALAVGVPLFVVATRSDEISCARAADSLDHVWNAARRDRLARELGARGAGALAAIDAKATSWREARVESCRATHERGDQSPDVLDRRARCLDRQALELDALASAIEAGQVPWWRALEVARALPDAERCSGLLAGTDAPPTGPRADAIAKLVADGHTAQRLGREARARELAERAVVLARGLADPGLLAEALALQGRATAEIDPVAARRLLEEALALAARSRIPVIETTVAIALLEQAGLEEATGRVTALLPVVTAALERVTPDRALLAKAREQQAGALAMLGRHDDALRRCDEVATLSAEPDAADLCRCHALSTARHRDAIAACTTSLASTERTWGAKHPRVATALINLAGVTGSKGEYDRGIELARQALAIDEEVLGQHSTSAQRDLGTLAGTLALAGKYAESTKVVDLALARLAKTPGQTDSMRAQLLSVRATNRLELRDVDGGRRDAVDALAFGERAWGAEHPKVVLYHIRIAQSLGEYEKKDCAAAIKSFTRAAELANKVYGANAELRLVGLQGAAACLVQLGRASEAKPMFELMLGLVATTSMQPYNVAMIHGAFAECLLAMRDRDGARREFGKAREILVKIPEAAGMVKQLDAYVKQL